jgi:hypothetical protein
LFTPLILAEPVKAAIAAFFIIVTPTNELDGMAPDHLTSDMRIDSLLIMREIFVNSETHHHRAIGEQFSLNLFEVGQDLHGARLAIVFCIGLFLIYTFEIAR